MKLSFADFNLKTEPCFSSECVEAITGDPAPLHVVFGEEYKTKKVLGEGEQCNRSSPARQSTSRMAA